VTHQPAISFSNSFHFPFNRAGGRTSNVDRKKKKKPRYLLISAIGAASFASSCERPPEAQRLSYAEVLKEAEGKKGEIAEVQGRKDVSYIWVGSATTPIAIDSGGSGGTTHRGLTMNFPDSPGYYHEIDVYDGSDGGGLLIGRKIAADPKVLKQ
jgi:hypothetical protein